MPLASSNRPNQWAFSTGLWSETVGVGKTRLVCMAMDGPEPLPLDVAVCHPLTTRVCARLTAVTTDYKDKKGAVAPVK